MKRRASGIELRVFRLDRDARSWRFFHQPCTSDTLSAGLEWTFHFLEVQLRGRRLSTVEEAPIENPLRSSSMPERVAGQREHDASTSSPW